MVSWFFINQTIINGVILTCSQRCKGTFVFRLRDFTKYQQVLEDFCLSSTLFFLLYKKRFLFFLIINIIRQAQMGTTLIHMKYTRDPLNQTIQKIKKTIKEQTIIWCYPSEKGVRIYYFSALPPKFLYLQRFVHSAMKLKQV